MIENNQSAVYRSKTLNPSFSGVVLDYLTKTLYENEINYMTPLKICKEAIMSSFVVAYMYKNHFLIDEINKEIEDFQSNGLMVYWINKNTQFKHSGIKSASSRPTTMKLENLKGAFEILFYGLIICSICFIIEISSFRMKIYTAIIKFEVQKILLRQEKPSI